MKQEEIETALEALCQIAGEESMPFFRQSSMKVENKEKSGFDPVTQADQAAEKAMRRYIERNLPNHGVIGEEFGSANADAEYTWVLDPVDGTRAFICGLPVWGSLIALCRNGTPIAGAMHQPFTGETFWAAGAVSSFRRGSDSRTLATSGVEDVNDAILMATAPEIFKEEEMPKFSAVSDACRLTRYGADCYAYCMLAAGQVDLVIEAGLQFYDIAALIPIIENAGGIVTDWENRPVTSGGQVIASANAALHRAALDLLN